MHADQRDGQPRFRAAPSEEAKRLGHLTASPSAICRTGQITNKVEAEGSWGPRFPAVSGRTLVERLTPQGIFQEQRAMHGSLLGPQPAHPPRFAPQMCGVKEKTKPIRKACKFLVAQKEQELVGTMWGKMVHVPRTLLKGTQGGCHQLSFLGSDANLHWANMAPLN